VLRCFSNLLENALKYAASGGYILVCAGRARHSGRPMAEVVVEDRGPGIRDDETGAIFEPFYRGFAARRSRQPGSGLGLAIVKSAVEAHGGWIRLEQAVPRGCRFRLFFPAADAERLRSAASEALRHAFPSDPAGR
jgi:signal transduction histidine kinase